MNGIRLAAALTALVFGSAVAAQQRDTPAQANVPQSGNAAISGAVLTDEDTPKPLRRVVVTLTEVSSAIPQRLSTTDDKGQFSFRGLPAGRYTLQASRPPYLATTYGARRVKGPGSLKSGTTITLATGQHAAGLTMRMLKGAAIEGVVRDTDGQPARGLTVSAWYFGPPSATGERSLVSPAVQATTDDRGIYRLYGLAPGEYVIAVVPQNRLTDLETVSDAEIERALQLLQQPAQMLSAPAPAKSATVGYAPVFAPGAIDAAGAATIKVAAGEERAGVDVQVRLVPTSRVEGTVVGPDGAPASRASILVLPSLSVPTNSLLDASSNPNQGADGQGRFAIVGVLPGSYSIVARQVAAGGPVLYGVADIVLQGQDAVVTIPLSTAPVVSGRIVFEGASPPPDASQVRVSLIAPMISAFGSIPKAGAEFSIPNVLPNRYGFSASIAGPADPIWYLKSATLNGREILDSTMEVRPGANVSNIVVTFTDRPTEISGALTDGSGRAAPDYFIVVFPNNRAEWTLATRRITQTRPSSDGSFRIRGLPPGDYRIAAVTDLEWNEWFDPAFLEQLIDASVPFTLTDGGKSVQNLRIK